MKLSYLISQRKTLLLRTHLANLAYLYLQLETLASRLNGAQLRGLVRLQPRDPSAERYWPILAAIDGNQSVIEEHFTDANIADLADAMAFNGCREDESTDFRLEELEKVLLNPIRNELIKSGVQLEHGTRSKSASETGSPS